jgi:hypothetical protein
VNITEKAAYLKGLAEGLSLEADTPQAKLFSTVIDLLDDLALSVSDLEDEVAVLGEQVDAVDEDLDALETALYEDDDEDDDDKEEDGFFEIQCEGCGEIICVDEGTLDEGSIVCPGCGETLEFDFSCDCEECRDHEEESAAE